MKWNNTTILMAQRNFKHVPFFLMTFSNNFITAISCTLHNAFCWCTNTCIYLLIFRNLFCGISIISDLWYHRERIHSAVDYIYDCSVYDIAIWMIYKMAYNLNYQYILCWGDFFVIKHGDWYCCMHFLKDSLNIFVFLLFFICCILYYVAHFIYWYIYPIPIWEIQYLYTCILFLS